jgi:hypothetical protein
MWNMIFTVTALITPSSFLNYHDYLMFNAVFYHSLWENVPTQLILLRSEEWVVEELN